MDRLRVGRVGKGRFSALVLLIASLAAGCGDFREEYFINPDGSAKMAFSARNVELPTHLLRWEGGLPSSPDELALRVARALFRSPSGETDPLVDAWRDLEFGFDENGLFHISGIAYFQNLAKLDDENRTRLWPYVGSRGPSWTAMAETRKFESGLFGGTYRAAPAASPQPPPIPPTDAQIESRLAALRIAREASLREWPQRGNNIRIATIVHTPVAPTAATDFAPVADAPAGFSHRFRFNTTEWIDEIRKRTDDAWLRERLRKGGASANPLDAMFREFHPQPSLTFDAPAFDAAAPLFDYTAEVALAHTQPTEATRRFLARGEPAETSPDGQPPVPRLEAGRPLPVGVAEVIYQRPVPGLPPNFAPNFGMNAGPGWSLVLLGQPLPARAFNAKLELDRIEDADGRPLRRNQPGRGIDAMAYLFGLPPSGLYRPQSQRFQTSADDPGPGVVIRILGLDLPHDRPRIGRLEGRVVFDSYNDVKILDSGLLTFPPAPDAPPSEPAVEQVDDDRKRITLRIPVEYNHILGLELRAENDRNLPYRQQSVNTDATGVRMVLGLDGLSLPERFRIVARSRDRLRRVVVPFALRDLDLLNPPPPPDPFALEDLKFVDDETDIPPPEEPDRLPRLAANRTLPATVFSARHVANALTPEAARRLDLRLYAPGGWHLQFYAAPLPARTFAADAVHLTEATLPDGRALLPAALKAEGVRLVNNPHDVRYRHRAEDGEIRWPMLQFEVSGLIPEREDTRVERIAGQAFLQTFARIEELSLGQAELRAGAEGQPRNWRLTHVEAGRVRVELDGLQDELEDFLLRDEAGGIIATHPQNNQIGIGHAGEGRVWLIRHFEKIPERAELVVRRREGIRNVIVPFEITDIDLANPAPLPDPAADPNGKYTDDEEDRAEVLQALADEQEKLRRQAEEARRAAEEAEKRLRETAPPAGTTPAVDVF